MGVPVIVTGPNHFEKNNAVMKHIAAAFAGENLLLNWVETDNYKTIAAAAMGYGHCVVAQTPIDVNMCKQLNILLTNMGVAPDKIVVDPDDRRAGLRSGIHLLGDGAHPHLGLHRRPDAGHADDREPGLRGGAHQGEPGAAQRTSRCGDTKKSAARCWKSPRR